MTSVGTLVMFWFVALALLYRRYAVGLAEEMGVDADDRHFKLPYRPDPFKKLGQVGKRRLVAFWISGMTICPIIFTVFFNGGYAGVSAQPLAFNLGGYDDHGVYQGVKPWWPALTDKRRDATLIAMTVLWGIFTLGLQLTCPMEFVPQRWHIPFWAMPWLPSCSLFSLTLLVGSFGGLELDYLRIGYCVLGAHPALCSPVPLRDSTLARADLPLTRLCRHSYDCRLSLLLRARLVPPPGAVRGGAGGTHGAAQARERRARGGGRGRGFRR